MLDCLAAVAPSAAEIELPAPASYKGIPSTQPSDRSAARLTAPGRRLRRLQRRLDKYHGVLTAAWTDETRHPKTPRVAGQPDSVGQCGVSSAWLLHRLAWPARRNARYCFGDVLFSGSDEIAASHCWIEIGRESSARRLVIDLTFVQFDQFSRFEKLRDRAVLCEYYEDLTERSIEYKAVSRRRFKELRSDAVWPRYQILKRATSPAWRKAVRSFYLTRMAPWFRSLTIHQRVSGAFGAGAIQYGAA